ncbi:hypothetical protein [Aurantimonas sp. Leaf443]|uniref:hypothetical protein n=1 Tax=Aurantimonas sp. Leaf443 TaxID=1736378 RepID=UPI0006FD8D55|nr:hypothetical protein [Aurantimonas sp. Leaf443]KQT87947.1 hypothetical protein ASG48_00315 [Aurantimonas sp. Leaf443]
MTDHPPKPGPVPDGPRLPGRPERAAEEGVEQAEGTDTTMENVAGVDETSEEPLADADPTVPLLPEER